MSAAAELKRLMPRRDRLAAELAALDRKLAAAGARYCDERGYRVRLRPEQIRSELDRAS